MQVNKSLQIYSERPEKASAGWSAADDHFSQTGSATKVPEKSILTTKKDKSADAKGPERSLTATKKYHFGLDIPAKPPRRFDVVGLEHQERNITTGIRNIFDSHCHLDVVLSKLPECDFINSPDEFYDPKNKRPLSLGIQSYLKIEGCINNIIHPAHFSKSRWEWLTEVGPQVWTTIGCHPRKDTRTGDATGH